MRVLIDEMYSPTLAEQLRKGGLDAVAVAERKELRSLADTQIFAVAQAERRAILTENIGDFVAVADTAEQHGDHHGLLLVDPGKFLRGRRSTIGALLMALSKLLADIPDDAARSLRHWL